MKVSNPEKYSFYSIEEISTPKNGYLAVTERWWALNDDGKVMIFNRYYPQCNSNKVIAEIVSKKMFSGNVVFIPVAYVELDCRS